MNWVNQKNNKKSSQWNNLFLNFKKFFDWLFWKKEENNIYFSSIEKFDWKFSPNCKIIWDQMITLHNKNYKFYMNNQNLNSWKFIEEFENVYQNLWHEEFFQDEIDIYNQHFNDYWMNKEHKWMVLNFWNWVLKNRIEKWNILKYDFYKNWKFSWQLVFYMFSNQKIHPIDIITIKKKWQQIRRIDDIEVNFWLLSKKPELLNWIEWNWTFLFPYYNFDLNLYNIKIYLKELYFFIYYMTFSLFFKKNDKLTSYYKSSVIDIDSLNANLKDDVELRNDLKNVIQNREWYNIWTALKKIVPWNFDITYYYCFYSIKQKLYPCYISVDSWNLKWWKVNINLNVNYWTEWLSHITILNIFKKIQALEPKSFLYENLEDFNIKKDVWYISYSQLDTLKDIIQSYKDLFWK